MAKSQYPKSQGWIKAEFTMNTADLAREEDIKGMINFLCGGKPHETGSISQHGKLVRVHYRETSTA